jgi:hypothetical protein
VWFSIEAVAGTAAAAYVLDSMSHHSFGRYATVSGSLSGTILAGIVVSLFLLLLAWVVLEALLNLRPWARVVMLVIGWVTVVSAVINLLTLPASLALLKSVAALSSGDWAALAAVGTFTKIADLVFWWWVLHTLQANPAVRDAFACRSLRGQV